MKILVVGASGATGQQLVRQLLDMEQQVTAMVRSPEKLPVAWKNNKNLSIIEASISTLNEDEMAGYVKDCEAVACCLGHNLTFKGIYGKPGKLVTNAVRLLCNAIKKNRPQHPVKVVLMNTAGNRNRDLNEHISWGERLVTVLLRLLLPPHPDNEQAAGYLRTTIGQHDPSVQWVVVRPDTLINDEKVTRYDLYASPTRSAIFNPGKTSRVNVAHLMATLITSHEYWDKWKGQMPVVYNREV